MKRRTRIFAMATALMMPSLGMAAWYGMTKYSDQDDKLGSILRDYGYRELTPPSRLFGPGTLITVETLSTGAVSLHLACKMNDEALAALWQRSTTLDRRLVASIRQTFDSAADALTAAKAQATGKRIRDIDVSLLNMSVVTMSHESLLDVRSQYLKGNCEAVILGNLRERALVCQTEEVLQADVVYKFGFEDGLGSTEKLALVEQVAGSVGIDHHASNVNEVRGDDLYLGVKLKANCFKLADDDLHIVTSSL